MSGEDANYRKMTGRPVGRLIAGLAVPTVISMLVTAVYNTADTYFVSKLGTSAAGAVGVVFSLMAIIQAVGFTVGMGAGSWTARLLGARRNDEADGVATSAFLMSLALGLLLTVAGLSLMDPLVRALGATPTIAPYARDYARYILYAAPVMAGSFTLNNLLRAEGKASFAMVGITTGGILNIILDPVFIFVLGLGIAGAAIATAISQLVGFIILLSPFLRGKTITRLEPARLSRRPETFLFILKFGLPSFTRQGLASVASIALNVNAALYGDAAVAGMSIVVKIFMFVFSLVLGIGQGYQPVLGYNYGARRYLRVREAFFFTWKATVILMSSFAAVGFLAAERLMAFFIPGDPEVVRIGALALRAQCIAMPFMPLGVMCNMTFQSIGRSWTATLLAVSRQGLFFLPLITILPRIFGLAGIQTTQPAADLLTFVFSIPFALRFFRLLREECGEGPC